jgi:hypothetical protein
LEIHSDVVVKHQSSQHFNIRDGISSSATTGGFGSSRERIDIRIYPKEES